MSETNPSLYEQDYYQWTIETAKALKAKAFNKIDIDHLVEEIESMGASERRELQSRLEVLLTHLLKWQIQQSNRCNSWKATIKGQRLQIKRFLKQMPSLKNKLSELLNDKDIYQSAVLDASKETGLDELYFPSIMPYSTEQLLDEEYYPMN